METPIADLDDSRLRSLLAASRAGDRRALGDLLGTVRARVRGWATRLTRDPDDAEDLTQDVLLRLHDRMDAIEEGRRLPGWLHRVTRNLAHDRRELRNRRSELLARYTDPKAVAAPPAPAALDADALAGLVKTYRRHLTARQREVFDLMDLQGVPAAVGAERLGIAPSTVRVQLARARCTIRLRMLAEHPDLLEEYHDDL